MQLHNLQSPKRKRKKRIGRGGKRGTYSGRGMKGQKSRAGRKLRPELRDTIKKLPKRRGYRFGGKPRVIAEVTLEIIERNVNVGETITPKILVERGIIRVRGNKVPKVKILASGKITKKIFVKDCGVSKGAKTAIEKAGGSVTE